MQTVIRVIFIYVFILVIMRILGKREFGQLGPMEFISLLLVPDIVSQAIVGDDFSMTNALVAVTTLFAMVFLTSATVQLSKKAEDIIEGVPCVMVQDGKMIEAHMNKERISPFELFAEMHKEGIERLDQIKWAILESEGRISFIRVDG